MKGKKTFLKTIRVNGGMIHFDMSKPEQLKRLAAVIDQAADEISRKYDPDERVDFQPFSQNIAEEFDRIFGKKATIKTFGTDLPSMGQWEEFNDKFTVLVEKWLKEGKYAN